MLQDLARLLDLEAVEKPELERGGLRNGAHRVTFRPTQTHTVERNRDEHQPVLSNRFDGGAMAITPGPVASPEVATWRSRAAAERPAVRPQGDFVPPQDGLSVAHAAPGIRQVEYHLCQSSPQIPVNRLRQQTQHFDEWGSQFVVLLNSLPVRPAFVAAGSDESVVVRAH